MLMSLFTQQNDHHFKYKIKTHTYYRSNSVVLHLNMDNYTKKSVMKEHCLRNRDS